MSADLRTLTNAKLAKLIESTSAKVSEASNAIFDAALHGHERFSEIRERLGENDARVVKWRDLRDARDRMDMEARSRIGPVSTPVLYPTLLMQSPRYKPKQTY